MTPDEKVQWVCNVLGIPDADPDTRGHFRSLVDKFDLNTAAHFAWQWLVPPRDHLANLSASAIGAMNSEDKT